MCRTLRSAISSRYVWRSERRASFFTTPGHSLNKLVFSRGASNLYFARHLSLLLLGVVKPTAIEKHESIPLERALAAFEKEGVDAPSASILESVDRQCISHVA